MLHQIFSQATEYETLLRPKMAGEAFAAYRIGFPWTERHIQCVWFDEMLRPGEIPLAGGETLQVLDPGEWNLESGPDFKRATMLVRPSERCVRGDVEIHVKPSDWDAHSHAGNPEYANVVAHICWFPTPEAKTLPPGVLQGSLASAMAKRAGFSLDDVDVRAYPYAILPETPRPCQRIFADNPSFAQRLLAAAGQYRLRIKAERLAQRIFIAGDREQVLYEEIMSSLGYKNNQLPFRQLAQLYTAGTLRGLTREEALARYLGHGGLLLSPEKAGDAEAAAFLRTLWDIWWRSAPEEPPCKLPWKLSGIRPQNAPSRRLATAACLFTGEPSLASALDKLPPDESSAWHKKAIELLSDRSRWEFFERHLAFTSKEPAKSPTALLGRNRAAGILANILVPFAAAEGRINANVVSKIPPEDVSSPMRLAANHLFGCDHNPALYDRNGLYLQGLLQIYLDFCLNAKPQCSDCMLCARLADEGKC